MPSPSTRPTRRAFVVDDEAAIVEILAATLEERDIEVVRCRSGVECLERFEAHSADVLVTDIYMDELNGFELIDRIREIDPCIRQIVMTGYDSYDMIKQALYFGAYDYIDKPFDNIEAVADTIVRAMEGTRLLRENARLVERLQASNQRLEEANQRLVELNHRLRLQANTDALTRLYNRRYIDSTVFKEAERRNRYGDPLSVVMLDVDHFKDFNDRHGHEGGDRVLETVAQILRECARTTDIVGRYGGEEFIAVLPKTAPENALVFAERARRAIAEQTIGLDTTSTGVTTSVGVSGVTEADPPIIGRNLVVAADKALYAAKDAGRNQVAWLEDLSSIDDPEFVFPGVRAA